MTPHQRGSRAAGPVWAGAVRAGQTVVWWAILFGLYVVFISTPSVLESLVAAGITLVVAVLAVLAAHAEGQRWSPRPGWCRWLVELPAAVVRDSLLLARMVARERRGGEVGAFRRITLPDDPAEGGRRMTRRALGSLVLSATPGTYVVDDDADGGTVLVHALREAPDRLEKAIFG